MALDLLVIHDSTGRGRGQRHEDGCARSPGIQVVARTHWAWEVGSFMRRHCEMGGRGLRDELSRRRSREGPLLIGRGEGVQHEIGTTHGRGHW